MASGSHLRIHPTARQPRLHIRHLYTVVRADSGTGGGPRTGRSIRHLRSDDGSTPSNSATSSVEYQPPSNIPAPAMSRSALSGRIGVRCR
ncbi:hypothetical protein [Embleya scabrispora]|uniref:hypothetical protein n=1 Tax=Embleya scabrispora TaxID=159449 RepID=UPI001374C7E1|nr:hypothetical protein [Embleya scabrispora]